MSQTEGNPIIELRDLAECEIDRELFRAFERHQVVDLCFRRDGDGWEIRSDPFIDDWSEDDYQILVSCLRNTVSNGGAVFSAFADGELKGFASVESEFFGANNCYLDLTSLHVSEDMRGKGIGSTLFRTASEWAKNQGAKKLYISSHSAIETQAFYEAMGCVDATEINERHVSEEPFDRQLEYDLV